MLIDSEERKKMAGNPACKNLALNPLFEYDQDIPLLIFWKNHPDTPRARLIQEFGFQPSSISRLASRLEIRGLIKQTKRGNEFLVKLTPRGEKAIACTARDAVRSAVALLNPEVRPILTRSNLQLMLFLGFSAGATRHECIESLPPLSRNLKNLFRNLIDHRFIESHPQVPGRYLLTDRAVSILHHVAPEKDHPDSRMVKSFARSHAGCIEIDTGQAVEFHYLHPDSDQSLVVRCLMDAMADMAPIRTEVEHDQLKRVMYA